MFEREFLLPTAEEIVREIPLPAAVRARKEERDALIRSVLAGKDGRLLAIVGPCSVHEADAALTFAERLARLNERVRDKLVLIPRIYTAKPRSRGGYMGMLFCPVFGEGENLAEGIRAARRLHISVAEKSGLTSADELLYPELFPYFGDVLSYCTVGARSSENQAHRFAASGLEIPVGIKNPMSGSLPALADSVRFAQSPHVFGYCGWQVRTQGDAYAHAVLRGYVDTCGRDLPNYGQESLRSLYREMRGLKNPAVIVDCNHSNSGKDFRRQEEICMEVTGLAARDGEIRRFVKGFMIESFLEEGHQPCGGEFGKSVTDPCLGWPDTERLLLRLAERL